MAETELDLELPADVEEILTELGEDATLDPNIGTYNPETGETTLPDPLEDVVTIKVTPSDIAKRYRRPASAVSADCVVFASSRELEALEIVPAHGMKITVGGEEMKITAVTTYKSGNLKAAYGLWLNG